MKIVSKSVLAKMMAVLITGLLFSGTALAAGETTFSGPVLLLTNWLGGSLGTLISVLALAVAVISAINGKLAGVVTAVGIAIAVQVGPGVMAGMFNATLPL